MRGCRLVLPLGWVVACAPAPSQVESAPPASEPSAVVTVAPASPEPAPASVVDEPPPPKSAEPEEITGTLSLTKGAQPLIGGRMLPTKAMEERYGPAWRQLAGRRFRVRGIMHDHRCDPRAQCMQGGVIPTVQDVTAIELCEGDPPVEGIETVRCPRSGDRD